MKKNFILIIVLLFICALSYPKQNSKPKSTSKSTSQKSSKKQKKSTTYSTKKQSSSKATKKKSTKKPSKQSSTKEVKSQSTCMLKAIIFDHSQQEVCYFYQERLPYEFIYSESSLDEYDFPFNNTIDSILYSYNSKGILNKIKVCRQNTDEVTSLFFDDKGRINKCIRRSTRPDRFNPDKEINYEYDKNTISVSCMSDQKSLSHWTYTIDSKGKLLNETGKDYNKEYKYNNSEKLVKIITEKGEMPIEYDDINNIISNYGNTPNWFCVSCPDLWLINTNIKKINKKEKDNNWDILFGCKYNDKSKYPYFVTETHYNEKGEMKKTFTYKLRYLNCD